MTAPSASSRRAAAVFDALGDGTRRELFAAVGAAGSVTATELAADRPLSRQAVVKHLQLLAAAGLVQAEKVGREQRYRLTPAPLDDAAAWMASVGVAWDERLGRLAERHTP
ncbi:ArsR/SmtB family transcription factor [Aquihabitans sp. McL0605]|uniref:ArsR/SmtB family transcription factor n=1 Tax=Aquihabitans sp. McL0605 TaxID=3415671 RepID=UPI003CEA4116